MANRRMFSKTITSSSSFLMMPQSSQNLYFHLGMNADDDGFCEHFSIMRMTDSKPDDLKVLQSKKFVCVFDDKVLVITDWKENNYLRSDRYTPSKYLDQYKKELKLLSKNGIMSDTVGIPDGVQPATQVRLGKVRLGEDTTSDETSHDVVSVIDAFKEVNNAYKKWYGNTTQRKAIKNLINLHGVQRLLEVVSILPRSNKLQYFPTITTPQQLEDKWASLESAMIKKKSELQEKKDKNKVAFI